MASERSYTLPTTLRLVLIADAPSAERLGVDLLQIVEATLDATPAWSVAVVDRDRPPGDGGPTDFARLERLRRLRALTGGRALLWVNQRVDLALACDADGVQLPERGLPFGRSCHDRAGLEGAEAAGASWALLSPVAAPISKTLPPGVKPLGLEGFSALAGECAIPVFALGGVDRELAEALSSRGASGVASIGEVVGSSDPGASAAALVRACARAEEAPI